MSKPTPDETARRLLYSGKGFLTFRQFRQAMFEEHPDPLTDEVLYDLYVNRGRPAPPVVDPASVTQARAAEEHRARMDKADAHEARARAKADQHKFEEQLREHKAEHKQVKRVVKPTFAQRVRQGISNLLPPRT